MENKRVYKRNRMENKRVYKRNRMENKKGQQEEQDGK